MNEHDPQAPGTPPSATDAEQTPAGPPPPPVAPEPAPGAPGQDWWHDQPAPAGGPRPPVPTRTKVIAAVGAAVVAVLAVAGIALVAPRLTNASSDVSAGGPGGGALGPGFGGRGPGGMGTVASVDGSTFTITTFDGSTTKVETSGDTTFSATVEGTLADIAVGDTVMVTGTSSGTTVAAERIAESDPAMAAGPGGQGGFRGGQGAPPGDGAGGPGGQGGMRGPGGGANGPGGGFTRGTVASVNGSTLTVTTADGSTVTVTASASTAVTARQPSSLGDLAAGDQVRVVGTTGTDGTITARTVEEGAGGFAGPGGGMGRGDRNGNTPPTTS